jgi:hypothetical protein
VCAAGLSPLRTKRLPTVSFHPPREPSPWQHPCGAAKTSTLIPISTLPHRLTVPQQRYATGKTRSRNPTSHGSRKFRKSPRRWRGGGTASRRGGSALGRVVRSGIASRLGSCRASSPPELRKRPSRPPQSSGRKLRRRRAAPAGGCLGSEPFLRVSCAPQLRGRRGMRSAWDDSCCGRWNRCEGLPAPRKISATVRLGTHPWPSLTPPPLSI